MENQEPKQQIQRIERFSRSAVEHTDDLFKLKVATGKRNVSWKHREPSLVTYEHCHFFHSINDTTLQANKFSTPTGGHFHEVTVTRDAEGNIIGMKCGPAMEMVVRKVGKDKSLKRPAKVQWESYLTDGEQERLSQEGQPIPEFKLVEDAHTHEMEYLGSETFTPASRNSRRKEEQASVKAVSVGQPVSTQPTASQMLTASPAAKEAQHLLKEAATTTPRNDDGTDVAPPAGAQ